MLDKFRETAITWDKANRKIYESLRASAGDNKGRKLSVQLVNDGVIEDLSGASLSLFWETRDKTNKGLDAFTAVDATKGEFELSYTTGMLSNEGTLNANLVLVDTSGRVVSEPFIITVFKGIDDDAIQSSDSFTALTEALIDISDLEQNYAPRLSTLEQNDVSLSRQLQHTTALLNQLKNISLYGEIKPFIVESMTDFGWVAYGTPTGYANYPGGNLFFKITGIQGATSVTLTEGNISHAGTADWAAVIRDDAGNWNTYKVTGVDGNKLNIYPALHTNITNGEIGSLHDEPLGQHYTERGYKALAQHIYKYNPRYAERNKFIASFDPQFDTLAENPFTLTDNVNNSTIFTTTPFLNNITFRDSQKTLNVGGSAGYTLTHEWEVQLDNKRGFLETAVSAAGNAAKIEFYLDDVLTHSEDVSISGKVTKVYYDFANAQTGKLKIFFPSSTAFHTIYIGKTTWWLNEKEVPKLIPPHSKVVYLGDSWGVYHDKAITRELSKLITKDSGTTIDIINNSMGGMTSKWGKAWFDEYVIKNQPTHVIIEFFTNDFNSINAPSNAYNYLAPDGQTFNGNIAIASEWVQNIFDMVNLSIEHGIQPIVVAPAPTAIDARVLLNLNNSKLLLRGLQG